MSTDRGSALRAFRPQRTDGLPPPPVRAVPVSPPAAAEPPGVDGDVNSPGESAGAVESDDPTVEVDDVAPGDDRGVLPSAGAPEATEDVLEPEGPFTFRALVERPWATCKAMTDARMQQPSKPLNVDISPATAQAFDDRIRTMRLKKKDVVEVLLRAWLAASEDH